MSDQNVASGHSHFADIVHDGTREQGVPGKYVRLGKTRMRMHGHRLRPA